MGGIRVARLYPLVANRDCNHCQDFFYNEDTGEPYRERGGDRYQKRPPYAPPPCRTRIGCPKGTPEEPLALTDKNRQCYQFTLECLAVGSFPEGDAIVRRNAAFVVEAEEAVKKTIRDREAAELRTSIEDMANALQPA